MMSSSPSRSLSFPPPNSISISTTRTVIIFDWDDTICPSSFVDQRKVEHFSDLPQHYQNLFNEIGRCAEKCLAEAAKHGTVIIITNSDEGWVKYSAERYVPNLLPVIPKYRIVSARTRYERFYPGQPLCWKAAAFAHEVNEIYAEEDDEFDNYGGSRARIVSDDSDNPDLMDTSCESMDSLASMGDDSFDSSVGPSSCKNNSICGSMFARSPPPSRIKKRVPPSSGYASRRREIISFGDSMEERTAVKIVSGQLSSVPKSVMFLTCPTPLQLIGQLTMLTGHMRFVCRHESTLDLEISPQQAQKCAESVIQVQQEQEQKKSESTTTRPAGQSCSRSAGGSSKAYTPPRICRTRSGSSEISVV